MMKMLIGEYEHSIDTKGRIIFPVKLREGLGEKFIVTKGLDNCLFVYSLTEWERLEQKIKELPMVKGGAVQKFLFASASLVEADKQGRILIPANLRSYAGLDKDVVVIGVSVRAEIWDKARWEELCSKLTSDVIGEAMEELGF